jgi:hypothetical protein
MAPPRITQPEFEFLARRAGLTLSAQQKTELYGAWGTLEALIERLRSPALPDAAEPATILVVERSGAA